MKLSYISAAKMCKKAAEEAIPSYKSLDPTIPAMIKPIKNISNNDATRKIIQDVDDSMRKINSGFYWCILIFGIVSLIKSLNSNKTTKEKTRDVINTCINVGVSMLVGNIGIQILVSIIQIFVDMKFLQ